MTIKWLKPLWRDNKRLRRLLLVSDLALVLFCVCSVMLVSVPAEKHSDGFEILAAIPLAMIALCLTLPALLLLIWNRSLRISAFATVVAVVMNLIYWSVYLHIIAGDCVYVSDFCVILY